jgi:hypothetical protein
VSTLRVVLIGSKGAGKSPLFDAIAHAAGVPVTTVGAARSLTTITAAATYVITDASEGDVPSVLAAGAEATILVVSAADGPMPATRAHVEASRHAGAPLAAVYLDDTRVEDEELADLVELEVRELASRFEMNGDALPVIRARPSRKAHVSSPIPAIASALDAFATRRW